MERIIYKQLLEWKVSSFHKPLILLGARQVGKTYILKEFGKEFSNMVYLNCQREVFAASLFRNLDINRIIRELERFFETQITDGKTLLVLDEIQEVSGAIASLKYFCEERPALHVAAAGSLLGISLRDNESYPVGKVTTMRLYPLTFSEFLRASDRQQLSDMVNELDWSGMAAMDEILTEYLREYYVVGGMPEVVQSYVLQKDINKVRQLQHEILDAYLRDMAKHTRTLATRIHQVWESIPSQLAKENKKFVFGKIKKGARANDFETALQWLLDAGIVYKIRRTKEPQMPLKFYADDAAFKLYLLDCGLLSCMTEANPREMLLGSNAFIEFKGAFAENYVLEQLQAVTKNSLFYFSKENSTLEIDFLVQTDERIIPVEVKAAENVKSKSLSQFINIDHAAKNLKGVRASLKPYYDQGWMENIPLYAVEAYFRNTSGNG